MPNEPTPEELALARRCAAKYWQTGEASDEVAARSILSGAWDDQAYVQAALAAIRETTSLGCAWLESVATKRSDRMKIAALRTNAHLKDNGHDA